MENKFDINTFVKVKTKEETTKKLVERFKQRRKELKISQQELSHRSLVSYASIRRFEKTGDISLSALIKLANAIDCLNDFDKLFASEKITNLKEY